MKAMIDNVESIQQMSLALTDGAGSGEFQERLRAEVTELRSSVDDIAKRSRMHQEVLSSARERVDTLLADIRQLHAGIDELTARISRLDVAAAAATDSASALLDEFKVTVGALLSCSLLCPC